MKTKLINEAGEKTYAIVFGKGDEVVEGLLSFALLSLPAGAFTFFSPNGSRTE
jgi:hypothetical protein